MIDWLLNVQQSIFCAPQYISSVYVHPSLLLKRGLRRDCIICEFSVIEICRMKKNDFEKFKNLVIYRLAKLNGSMPFSLIARRLNSVGHYVRHFVLFQLFYFLFF